MKPKQRRLRRAKTKLLCYSTEMANLILENPDKNTKHFSDMMQRGHLVAMNVNDVEEDFQQFVAKFERLGLKFKRLY